MSTKPVAHQVMPGANGAESAAAQQGAVRTRDSLFHWCGSVDAILQTSDRSEKRALLDAYFEGVAEETVAPAARFFAGDFLPSRGGKPATIEWTVVSGAIQELTRMDEADIRARCEASGDLGKVAADAFAGRLPSGVAVADVAAWAEQLGAATDAQQQGLVRDLIARVSSLEARYLVNLITGDFDVGLEPADIEAAVATRLAGPSRRRPGDRRQQDVPRSGGTDEPQRRRRRAS